jgi:dUTP pyrophosphatase
MDNSTGVYIKLINEGRLPEYKSEFAAGCDLYATKDLILRPGDTTIMPLGFILSMDSDIEAQIRPRSGLSLKTFLRLPNSIGTIDSDYKDEVGILLTNEYNIGNLPYEIASDVSLLQKLHNEYSEITLREYLQKNSKEFSFVLTLNSILNQMIYVDKKGNPYGTIYLEKGERIGQMVFSEYKKATFIPHESPETLGHNRGGGFGSTGE